MKNWWKRRSVKLRLTLWHATVTAVVLTVFASLAYENVEHRLRAELDRQLRIDFDLVEAQLDTDTLGNIVWPVRGAHGDEGFARLSAWFEVWSEDKQLLLRHWPVSETIIKTPSSPPLQSSLQFRTIELEPGLHVRLMERPARIHERGVIVRMFRDESDLRYTLSEIVEVFILAAPLVVILAASGGYVVARRSLQPVAAMAEQVRKITSESLSERLPNPNPYDELGQLAYVFNQTLQRLDNSFNELKRFTADASHELRTPLTALRTVGEVGLRAPENSAALRDTVSSMLEEAEHLNELIDSMLALARMDSGKLPVKSEPISVSELVYEVCASLGVLATEKQQELEVTGDNDMTVLGDRALLRQALVNIIHNAIRYSPPQTKITIRIRADETGRIIEIVDQGPGIAPEYREKIFERFYRVDKSRSRADGGHGLGLAIAKWSIEHQSGRIEVESGIGKGSTFRILFPGA